MPRTLLVLGCALALGALGCGGGDGAHADTGTGTGIDAATGPDAFMGGPQDAGPGVDGGCIPSVEICGDFIDENCDGHEASCGDNDGDHFDACRPTDVDLTMCDCDDGRSDVFPARGTVPGGREACDSIDNDCDGRIDESSACCSGCAGIEPTRADACTLDGQCDCLGASGTGACASGQTCCTAGCFDTSNDMQNCGGCHSACDASSDRCTAGSCHCGTGSPCDGVQTCTGGVCG